MASLQIYHLAALAFYTMIPAQRQGGPVAERSRMKVSTQSKILPEGNLLQGR